jgi:hypothetical protein
MHELKSPWTRAFLVWTIVALVAAIVVAVDAVIGLLRSADACFFQTGPCSQAGDPDVIQLQVAFFGIPLVWLLGVLVGAVGRAIAGRSRTDTP